jgi:DNA-binding response OmpR family regulator
LVVEDNAKMARFIRQGFKELGWAVDVVHSGQDGEQEAFSQSYDTIILDVMLPDVDGVQVCRNLRRLGIRTPILMLTALSSVGDKVSALDAGADDYLTKPFNFAELVARVRALMRRGQPVGGTILKVEDLEMDLAAHTVSRGGKRIKLSNKEFALLEYFMRNPNHVLTRASIAEHVWDMSFSGESNVIDVYVGLLRRRVDKDSDRKLIHTIIGRGYCLGIRPTEA